MNRREMLPVLHDPQQQSHSGGSVTRLGTVIVCGPAQCQSIFVSFKMFFVTGLKAHNGLLSVGGDVQR